MRRSLYIDFIECYSGHEGQSLVRSTNRLSSEGLIYFTGAGMLKITKEEKCYPYGFEPEYWNEWRATFDKTCLGLEAKPDDLAKKIDPHHMYVKGFYLLVYNRQMYCWKPYEDILTVVAFDQVYDLIIGPLEQDLEDFQKKTVHTINRVKDLVFRSVTGL